VTPPTANTRPRLSSACIRCIAIPEAMAQSRAAKFLPLAVFAGLSSRAGGLSAVREPRGGKVKVELYYETMCPYCEEFINSTLSPLWSDPIIRSVMDLHLLPAGNVMVVPGESVSAGYKFWHPEAANDKYIYRCQHGESECLGNMVQLCAMKVLGDAEKYLPLVFCMASRANHLPEKSSYECMQELKIDQDPIFKCVHAPTASEEMFLITKADAALSQPRKYVPWIMVNGQHLEVNNGTAELRAAICDSLGSGAPANCQPAAAPGANTASATALAALGAAKSRVAEAKRVSYAESADGHLKL